MAIDARIIRAINEAVEEAGQPETLARRLIAWFEAVTSGNEDINDQSTTARHLEVLFEGTVVQNIDGGEQD
ncbi:CxC ATPase DNA modification system associated small protein [Sinorhizobium meliloti]|uniref:CxC ATPase DNA modification system associated small protein n=1 Tax=Rhizobium meliloti TaxID=382 RepID=UPI00036E77BA|nr:CxC ATPase DNA modification system associated small protein [Sinorhizobium meliloti]